MSDERPRELAGRSRPLDGVRTLLVAVVMGYHLHGGAFGLAGGEVALQVYFALSGFLITALLIAERRRRGAISMASFFRRRALRLLPPLAFLLALWFAVVLLFGQDAWLTTVPGGGAGGPISVKTAAEGVAAALGYVTNWFDALPGLHLWTGYVPLGHLWSLAVEEQFYMTWAPMLVLLTSRRRWAVPVTAALALVSLAEPWALWHGGQGLTRIYFGTDTRASALLLGALAAWLWTEGKLDRLTSHRYAPVAGGVAGAAIVVAALGFHQDSSEAAWLCGLAASAIASTVVVVYLLERGDGTVGRLLASRPLVVLGRRSYAMYLWAYVFTTWFGGLGPSEAPLTVAGTLVAAEASYRLVEQPALALGHRAKGPPAEAGAPPTRERGAHAETVSGASFS